ncbi:MAG: Ldh family oxidoreductase [Acidimicrobiales bacterium]|jgi:LDH2 family malate/lactate/ureidoglycolate dehydrogenase
MEATGPQTTPAGGEPLAAPRFSEDDLIRTGTDVLRALGAPGDTARVVATSLTLSNLVGHDSHGIVRLIQYSEWVKSGQIRPDGQPSVVSGRGAVANVDGAWGFGQPAAQLATNLSIDLAGTHGVSAVSISACNHIGRLGEYVATIASSGKMGMAWCNSGPVVAPFGGAGRVMGTNPFAWSAPLRDGTVVLDFATAKVAEGKLKIALAEGHSAPPGSIIDSSGKPSIDPADFYAGGSLLAFGDHKGSGMSMLIELTAGLVSHMGSSVDPGYLGGNGTLLMAVDISAFTDLESYFEQAETFRREAKRVGGGPQQVDILLPGEAEARALAARSKEGVVVPTEIRRQITELADELGVDIGPFGQR